MVITLIIVGCKIFIRGRQMKKTRYLSTEINHCLGRPALYSIN